LFGWEPSVRLYDGLEKTYAWIYDKMAARLKKQTHPISAA
jgi:hypothetical protein